jgi:guanylate kinase
MKIVLISGVSGSGKTTICKDLIERYSDKYNFINSYTDRERRTSKEWGHEFITSGTMDMLLADEENVVASTKIDKYRYCSMRDQFDDNKINLYIVDIHGINDTIAAFPNAKIMSILVKRHDIEVECERKGRDIYVPMREDVDFVIDNNGRIESSSNLLNALVNFDFFKDPSKKLQTIQEKLDYIDMQYRFLDDTRSSLLSQLWYQLEPIYIQLCKYVEKKVSEDINCTITIKPDVAPDIYDGSVDFNLMGVYEDDLHWDMINRIYERMSLHAQNFAKDNNCDELMYRTHIDVVWVGEIQNV